MIRYSKASWCVAFRSSWTFRLKNFRHGAVIAAGASVAALLMSVLQIVYQWEDAFVSAMGRNQVGYSVITTILGTLIVFRTSQAYSRFWHGTSTIHSLMGDLFTSASNLVAYCHYCDDKPKETIKFRNRLVRLVSLLSAMILAELEGREQDEERLADDFEVIDIFGLEPIPVLQLARVRYRPEIVFQWIKTMVVLHMQNGVLSIPAPILTRVFQELDAAMTRYHDAEKLANVPFPFPYVATLDVLLTVHTILTPVLFAAYTEGIYVSVAVTFVLVFVMWSLHFIASDLENPFEGEVNDLDVRSMQLILNDRLVSMCDDFAQSVPEWMENGCEHFGDIRQPGQQPETATIPRVQLVYQKSHLYLEELIAQSMQDPKNRRSSLASLVANGPSGPDERNSRISGNSRNSGMSHRRFSENSTTATSGSSLDRMSARLSAKGSDQVGAGSSSTVSETSLFTPYSDQLTFLGVSSMTLEEEEEITSPFPPGSALRNIFREVRPQESPDLEKNAADLLSLIPSLGMLPPAVECSANRSTIDGIVHRTEGVDLKSVVRTPRVDVFL